jgi:hypothetical protein
VLVLCCCLLAAGHGHPGFAYRGPGVETPQRGPGLAEQFVRLVQQVPRSRAAAESVSAVSKGWLRERARSIASSRRPRASAGSGRRTRTDVSRYSNRVRPLSICQARRSSEASP